MSDYDFACGMVGLASLLVMFGWSLYFMHRTGVMEGRTLQQAVAVEAGVGLFYREPDKAALQFRYHELPRAWGLRAGDEVPDILGQSTTGTLPISRIPPHGTVMIRLSFDGGRVHVRLPGSELVNALFGPGEADCDYLVVRSSNALEIHAPGQQLGCLETAAGSD